VSKAYWIVWWIVVILSAIITIAVVLLWFHYAGVIMYE
jgi:hypothetical protein